MEWRCEWCGKPHDDNDPPCDNCGHGSFEQAVVQQPAEGPAGDSTTVWVCTECGREHPKHAPPCSRCGNAKLERREITVDDDELEAPGYRDLLTPTYVAGVAIALVLGAILVLGLVGVIDIPGLSSGVPTVEDVPGNATGIRGTSLAAVEATYLDELNDRRSEQDRTELSRDRRLDEVATYFNQRRAKALAGEGSVPADEELLELLEGSCERRPVLYPPRQILIPTSLTSAQAIGERVASRTAERGGGSFPAETASTGLDVHALDENRVLLTQIAC